MDWMDHYKARVFNNGENLGKAFESNTDIITENAFQESPSYRRLGVKSYENPEITQMDARVVSVERMGTLREVLFRPSDKGLNLGTYITFDNDTWLVFDRFGNNKVMVSQCNRTLKWIDRDGELHEIDCVASASDLGSKAKQSKNEIEWNKYDVRLPLGQLFVFVELRDETKTIKLNQRFIFGSRVYEVTGIDDTTTVSQNGFGLLQLTIKVTTIRDADNFETRIAENFYDDTSTVIPQEGNIDEGQGGIIW